MKTNKAILVISFGSTVEKARKESIEPIENDLRNAFEDRVFYRAWTSDFVRKKVLENNGISIASVEDALDEMINDGMTDVLIQLTHMLEGEESMKAKEEIAAKAGEFEAVHIGRALLSDEPDMKAFVRILEKEYAQIPKNEMVVFMGHGSGHAKIPVYDLLNRQLDADGYPHMHVGSVEGNPGFFPVIKRIKERRPDHVTIAPLLVVAGRHVMDDMSGDRPDSWKNVISAEGIKVSCVMKGLGEYKSVRDIYVRHAIETGRSL